MREDFNIPYKTGRVLNLVLLAFILIFLRVWYLGFIQGDYHRLQARKPQRRTTLEKVERATIRDRFNTPLAQNKIEYSAAIQYADIRELPAYKWEIGPSGKKTKKWVRGPYITKLADLLGKELEMDSQEIEDIIYAKASLFPHTPFVVKKSLSEKQYYKLRMLQKDWVGITMQKDSKRIYPAGKTACDIVGYMGAISSAEYLQIAQEIALLNEYIQKREAGDLVFLPDGYESPLAVRERLKLLKEKSYTINDYIGKTGIESSCDEQLRGIHGKKLEEIDPRGTVLRALPGAKKGLNGQRVFLSISSELQEFAESLLAQHESLRDIKDSQGKRLPGTPWIKGGAAVALHPKTGEVLALASYPRFDPNDFVQSHDPFHKQKKQQSVRRWIENDSHIGEIWEGKTPLKKENYSFNTGWGEESLAFTWSFFLDTILPRSSSVKEVLSKIGNIQNAYLLQMHFETILAELDFKDPAAIIQSLYSKSPHTPCKKKIPSDLLQFLQNKSQACQENLYTSFNFIHSYLSPLSHNDDKLLVLDLIRLLIIKENWTPKALSEIGSLSFEDFFTLSQSFSFVQEAVKEQTRKLYHLSSFQNWREQNFKSFLKQKRKEEKENKTYAKPYTEYLEKAESGFFSSFWNAHKYQLLDMAIHGIERTSRGEELTPYLQILQKLQTPLLSPHLHKLQIAFKNLPPLDAIASLQTMRTFEELDRPLYGKYRSLRHVKGVQLEKHLASAFYPLSGFGYGRSQAFRESNPLGSVFKIVVAYEALRERYNYLKENFLNLKELNPLTLTDHLRTDMSSAGAKQILGQTFEGESIRRLYKGGILPRSSHPGIGKVDLPQAIEQSSNIYFSILAAEHIADPSLLEKTARNLGFGSKTGIGLQAEFPGSIPSDLSDNKTGLYSFAIGQHSLVATPLQTALMLSAFGNHGHILKPQIIRLKAGKHRSEDPLTFHPKGSYPFQEALSLAGIHFPLFTESLLASYDPYVEEVEPEVIRSLFLPKEIKEMLFDGMHRVVSGSRGSARPSIIQYLRNNSTASKTYIDLQKQLFGKTGTAEILYKQWLDSESKAEIHNHISFGGLIFPEGSDPLEDEAELAVVVYLRFSVAGGKEAAPIAAQIAAKWREIQKRHNSSYYLENETK
ncbi:MAG: penicillin-binding transpeptidase domain-containing protein [Chlamydiota bacterium]